MKNKNKGFTLIELLAVILVLGLVVSITSVIVVTSMSDSKNNVASIQEKNVISTAKAYFNDNLGNFTQETTPENCEDTTTGSSISRKCTIDSDVLVSEGYIEQPKDMQTKDDITYNIVISFELNDGNIKNVNTTTSIGQSKNTLSYKVINNSKYAIYGGANTNIGYNYYTEIGLYKTTYSSKDTYTYKGNVNDNYVTFAGKTWRILKINADGTIDMTTGGVKIPYTSSTTLATCSSISPDSTELNNWYDETFTETEKGKISSVKTYSNTNETFTDASDVTKVSYIDILDYKLSGSCYDDGTGYIEIATYTASTYYGLSTGQFSYTYSYTDLYTMPVITLKSSVKVSSGSGTSGSPYVIK